MKIYLIIIILLFIIGCQNIDDVEGKNWKNVEIVDMVVAGDYDTGDGCHRDGNEGCDLYLIKYNLTSKNVTNANRLTDDDGGEWFPSLDKGYVVYEKVGLGNKLYYLSLSLNKEIYLTDGRFPHINGGKIVYSSALIKNIYFGNLVEENGILRIDNIQQLTDDGYSSDPQLYYDNSMIIYTYYEDAPNSQLKGSKSLIMNLDSDDIFEFSPDISCGHPAFTIGRAVCGLATSSVIKARDINRGGELDELYNLVSGLSLNAFVEKDLRYNSCDYVVISYPEFLTKDYLVGSVQCVMNSDGHDATTFSELFLFDFTSSNMNFYNLNADIEEYFGVSDRDSVTVGT